MKICRGTSSDAGPAVLDAARRPRSLFPTMIRGAALIVLLVLAGTASACGKKGPPLAPLRPIPEAPAEVGLRRSGDTALLRFALPKRNQNAPGRVELDHVEIYAITAAPGTVIPPDRQLMTKAHLVGTIAVKPPPVEDAPPDPKAAEDKRPSPGDVATFSEKLTQQVLAPAPLPQAPVTTKPAAPGSQATPAANAPASAAPGAPSSGTAQAAAPVTPPAQAGAQPAAPAAAPAAASPTATLDVPFVSGPPATLPGTEVAVPAPPGAVAAAPAAGTAVTGTAPGAPAAPAAVPAAAPAVKPGAAPAPPPAAPKVTYPVRIYVVRGVTRGGRPGVPAPRQQLPLVALPAPPLDVTAKFTETAVTLAWTAPPANEQTPPPAIAFNVYKAGSDAPLNASPVAAPSFEPADAEFGKEQCFTVRTVNTVAGVPLESEPSAPACVTPRDVFPPAPPKDLNAVASPGAINLIWDPNTEPDLGGYIVLRGEAPGDTLQPLTPTPIHEANYRDDTVKPGVRYVYVVVAVDTAKPPNESPRTSRVEETAR